MTTLDEPTQRPEAALETSYEIELDPPPEHPPGRHGPVFVDATVREHEVRPVVPASLRGRRNLTATVRRGLGRTWHRLAYHTVRLPWYGLLVLAYAPRGGWRAAAWCVRWVFDAEQWTARQHAADRDDVQEYMSLARERDRHVRNRSWLAGIAAVLLGVPAVLAVLAAPSWAQLATAGVLLVALGRLGRPVDRRIINPAVVAPRFRRLNADIVLRAYHAARLGDPAKPDQQITFGSPMARDGEGSRVLVDLPYGRGLADAIKARDAIASGLDVAVSQVFITRDPTSNRRHQLWVADRDPLAIPAGRTPLLRCHATDIWQPAPFGLDERGRPVAVSMIWHSLLVGAQPRQGKTFSARALALYAALDPHVRLTVFDGKGSPDWRKFSMVADRAGFGLALTRDGDPVELLLDTLREIKADVQHRYEQLSALPVDVCPEGKLTREIARDPRFAMPVHLVVLDEFQEYFDLGEASKEIAALLVYLVKVAPAAGVIVLGATQRPSGIGTGQVAQQFISFRDNFLVRFALRTGSWQMSDLVLGSGAYSEGYDSSTLLPEYKGVGILRGATDHTPTVRTYLADGGDAERILQAARTLRERAGTVTGMAAGEDVTRETRDPLADVAGVFYAGEVGLAWAEIAARLAEQLPQAYADTTAEAISATVRGLGVPSVNVKRGGQVLKGTRREHVDQAAQRREIGSGPAATG